jgi:hypothetical protein
MSTTNQVIAEVTKRPGCQFISLTYKSKESGEVARHTIAVGVNLERAYRRDKSILHNILRKAEGLKAQAASELLQSVAESLKVGIGNNPTYTCAGVFAPVVPGIKLHKETGQLYVYGYTVGKKVLQPGTYKTVNSKPLTIEKNRIRKVLKNGRFRQFAIDVENLQEVRANNKTLELV